MLYPVTDPVPSIFSPGFLKIPPRLANLPPGCPFLSFRCFAFLKHAQMIYAEYVKVAPGKPHTGTGEAEEKNPRGWVSLGLLHRGVLLTPETRTSHIFLVFFRKTPTASRPLVTRSGNLFH